MMNDYAPIVVFTYARQNHTKKMIESLLQNEEASKSDLFVFSDGPKTKEKIKEVECVRNYLKSISGFKSIQIIERQKNMGLANNLIDGITNIIKQYKRIIVIEDDLILSKYFLRFMNDALDKYENEEKVSAVSGFVNPVNKDLPTNFFLRYFACWGWATWERAWNLFNPDSKDLMIKLKAQNEIRRFNIDYSNSFISMLEDQINGRINSWAIRFYASSFVNNKLILFPGQSLTMQNGIDGSGTHSGSVNNYEVILANSPIKIINQDVEENKKAYIAYRNFYLRIGGGWKAKVNRLLCIIGVR